MFTVSIIKGVFMKRPLMLIISYILILTPGSYQKAFSQELKPIKLVKPDLSRGKLLMQALKERKTNRSFSPKELNLDILSNLLWAACGVNRPESGKRTAPTAVNWQEIDLYVAIKTGVYLYDARKHSLNPALPQDIREYTGIQAFTNIAPVYIIYVANFSRMGGNMNDKIFYSAADTGFISQNVYLFCASEGLATVVLGLVDKDRLAKIMNLKENQRIILTQPVGYPE